MRTISESVEHGKRFGPLRDWTSHGPGKRLHRRKSFRILLKHFRLYCENSSLTGYKYLAEPRKSLLERFLWVLIHIAMMFSLVYMITGVYDVYLDAPVVTTVESDYYPTNYLNFPGVAICSVNRISEQSAVRMANEIANAMNVTFEYIFELFFEMGSLYQSTLKYDLYRTSMLHYVLQDYFNGSYDVTNIMKRLTPRCDDMLLKCVFNGQIEHCSTIFKFRKTQDGFCCVFNYAREQDDIYEISEARDFIESLRIRNLGIENGLTVILEPFLDDYFYQILPIAGWKVTIFNSEDYPDTASGGVSEALVSPLSEVYLELDAVSFHSTPDIRPLTVRKRWCFFNDENSSLDHSLYATYTYSDCIVQCKLKDILKLCGCQPFYFPRRGIEEHAHKICDFTDVPCLDKHKSKWCSVVPHELDENEKDLFDLQSLQCNCYPSCNDVHYLLHSSRSHMDPGHYYTNLMYDKNVTNQSILHIFFPKWGTIRLKRDVANRWYDLLSHIGGICGVFIGFSLISVVEFMYFMALTFRGFWRKSNRTGSGLMAEENLYNQPSVRTIYWSEIASSERILQAGKGWQRTLVESIGHRAYGNNSISYPSLIQLSVSLENRQFLNAQNKVICLRFDGKCRNSRTGSGSRGTIVTNRPFCVS